MKNRAGLGLLILSLLSLGLLGCDDNSSSTTVRTTEFDGAQGKCTNGGVKIEVLVDETVDDSQTQLICNKDGQNLVIDNDDKNLLVTTNDNVGDHCTDGGIRIDAGLDTNDNGTLDSDEILKSRFVCNDGNGQNLVIGDDKDLLVTTSYDVSNHCANSGIRIDSGLDTNGNGTLDSDEIMNSRYVCVGEQFLYTGDTITLGHYEQDNDTTNGKEPITWRVIHTSNEGKVLVISEKALDVQQYNTTNVPGSTENAWDKSTIRSWLNGYPASYNTVGNDYTTDNFIDTAFTAEEQARIVESNVPAHANPDHKTPQGDDTTDKVFLLSIPEAKEYLPGAKNYAAEATQYVIKKGAQVYGAESKQESLDGTCTDAHCYVIHWWLRTKGGGGHAAAAVGYVGVDGLGHELGGVSNLGITITSSSTAVRPAMWITY